MCLVLMQSLTSECMGSPREEDLLYGTWSLDGGSQLAPPPYSPESSQDEQRRPLSSCIASEAGEGSEPTSASSRNLIS